VVNLYYTIAVNKYKYIFYLYYTEECPTQVTGGFDLVFILDSSGSIAQPDFINMTKTVINIVSSLTIGPNNTRVAVIVFDTDARLVFNFNAHTNINSLTQAITNIEYTAGSTNTHLALQLLRENVLSEVLGARPNFQTTKVAIVITDGWSNNANKTKQEAEKLHMQTDYLVFAVGVGSGIGLAELTTIASSSEFVIQISNFGPEELQSLEDNIEMEACRGM